MFEKNVIKLVLGGVALLLSGLGIADLLERRETNQKIGLSMKELKEASVKEISESVVKKAVQDAADVRVQDYMTMLKSEIMTDARSRLNDEARRAVREASETIQKEVGDRISQEASLIDMTALKKNARDRAEERILSKFDGDLDDLLTKYNDNLSNVQKIYRGIADAITKDKEDGSKGLKFTIG